MERALANGNYYREEREDKRRKKQPALFELMGHSYQVIVTNIEEMSPEELWRFYNGRAAVEWHNILRALRRRYYCSKNLSI